LGHKAEAAAQHNSIMLITFQVPVRVAPPCCCPASSYSVGLIWDLKENCCPSTAAPSDLLKMGHTFFFA